MDGLVYNRSPDLGVKDAPPLPAHIENEVTPHPHPQVAMEVSSSNERPGLPGRARGWDTHQIQRNSTSLHTVSFALPQTVILQKASAPMETEPQSFLAGRGQNAKRTASDEPNAASNTKRIKTACDGLTEPHAQRRVPFPEKVPMPLSHRYVSYRNGLL